MSVELTVPASAAGTRLDVFLAEPLGSRARAQRLIEAGAVTIDGRLEAKRRLLLAGEQVRVDEGAYRPAAAAPDARQAPDVRFEIRYEDEHLLVVDKPAGLVVHPGRGHAEGTLVQALAGLAGGGEDPQRPGIVHRLDRDTSGLIVVARHDAAHRRLRAALAQRLVRREYLALVEGLPPSRTGTIDAPIGRDRRTRVLMSIDSAEPREARTHFELERALPTSSLLRVTLETGRTHQIRVHLQAIGLPVCGDRQYGGAPVFGLERQFLHAARLAFPHPLSGEPVDVDSPLPADLRAALERADTMTSS